MGKSIRNLSTVTRVGLDLAKRVFQVHAVEAKGEIVVVRKLTRSQLIPFFAELPPCVVAMEACSSAHHWGRALMELGHEVRLIPPAHVKPYVRRNKSDQVDAAAIYEAMSRPGQRFVPARSIDNQAELMRHRTRELLAGQRTAALNALRGHLAEIGLIAPQGAHHAYGLKRMAGDGFNENGEIVKRGIEPHVNLIDKSERTDGTFSRSDFAFDTERDLYVCPGGKELRKYRRAFSTPREGIAKDGAIRYRAAQHDCGACTLKPRCCPNMLAPKIARSVHEAARDKARAIAKTEAYAISCRERKKVEMLFAHLKRILRLSRLRLRGPSGAKDEFLLAATAQNLRKLAKLIPPDAHLRHMRRRARNLPR